MVCYVLLTHACQDCCRANYLLLPYDETQFVFVSCNNEFDFIFDIWTIEVSIQRIGDDTNFLIRLWPLRAKFTFKVLFRYSMS